MLAHRDSFHGSDLEKIEKIYRIRKEDIVSFSANVNPLGVSPLLRKRLPDDLDRICTYPDREYTDLRKAIGSYCGASFSDITVGNGSTELITLFIKLISPKKTMVISPTYSEYERELSLAGGTSTYFELKEEDSFCLDAGRLSDTLDDSYDMLIMCNPNNPTSGAITRDEMKKILTTCKDLGIFVMVDETYVEFCEKYDEISSVTLADDFSNLCILRGVSKFFAAPGLRLGYAICSNKDLLAKIAEIKDPWTVGSLTEAAGRIMFSDNDYINATKELIFTERRRVTAKLRSIDGLKVYEPSANFVLCRITKENVDADILFDNAIRRNMMIRNCSTFPYLDNSYFRICFMTPADNDRLLTVIEESIRSDLSTLHSA